MIRLASVVLGCSLTGCAGPSGSLDELPVRFETAHFRYHTSAARWICPRLADWLEQDYASRTSWLGASLQGSDKIDYYLLADLAAVGEVCGQPHGDVPSGCVVNRTVYSWKAFHPHELVHAYAGLLGADGPPLFFNEGLAVMLGGGAGGRIDRSVAVESLIETAAYREIQEPAFTEIYGPAGAFSRFVLDRYGRSAYLSFYASVPKAASSAEIRARFQAAFSESLEDALAAWRAGPEVTEDDIRIYLTECAMPALDAPSNEIDGVACGTMDASYPLGVTRALALAEPTGIVVRLRASRVIRAELRPCAARLVPERSLFNFKPSQLGAARELWTDLPAGAYWLGVAADGSAGEETADAQVSVDRAPAILTDRCSDAAERRVAADTAEIVVSGTFEGASDDGPVDGLADLSTRFRVAAPRLAATTSFTPSDLDHATLCTASCPGDAAPDCLARINGSALAPDASYTLTVAGTSGVAGYQFGLQFVTDPRAAPGVRNSDAATWK